MQVQIEQGKLDLAHGLQSALEIFGGEHLVEQCSWAAASPLSTCFVMGCSTSHSQQKFSMNWLGSSTASHSTPLMPDTPQVIDAGQQVVQAVAEFVEQGDHFIVREQRRFAADRRAKNCS